MRLGRRSSSGARSPYRVPGHVALSEAEARSSSEPSLVGVLLFVLGCSLLRVGLFLFQPEHFGVDPMLALAVAAASGYYLSGELGLEIERRARLT
jgi:hypothetical protein